MRRPRRANPPSAARFDRSPTMDRMRPLPAVLLIQLGTPDAPTVPALRRYLREFLSDPRVIEAPRLLWWFILNFRILLTRPAQSAARYRRIWNPKTGSPLLNYTRRQAEELQRRFPQALVRFAMQVGNPALAPVLRELIEAGVERLIVLPMYPQYSATTTASAYDSLFQALMRERRVPALRIVPPYYDHPAYLDALNKVIREELAGLTRLWNPTRLRDRERQRLRCERHDRVNRRGLRLLKHARYQ